MSDPNTHAAGPRPLDPLYFPLDGVRLIEASAGTGKTYTIANLYLRLLLEQGHAVDRILVVTFTNAATEELRDRIRRRLRDALALLEHGPGEAPDDLWALVRDAGADAPGRLRDALTRLDEAAIFTIHGFCQRMLQENAFESGTLFEAELVADEAELRRTALADFWRRRFHGADPLEAAWVQRRWGGPDGLLHELDPLLRGQAPRLVPQLARADAEAARADWEAALAAVREAWADGRDEVLSLLDGSPALDGRRYRRNSLAQAVAALDAFLAGPPLLELPKFFEYFTSEKICAALKAGQAAPAHRFIDLCDALAAATTALPRALRAALLAEAWQALHTGLAEHKARRRLFSYDDLLTLLDRAMAGEGGEALAGRIRGRYPVALIDEFQDTDPLQYRIFGRVYRGHAGCVLFMIGDPKQAIYGFRGADIFTYMQARRATDPARDQFTLDRNWRSAEALVAAVNALFANARAPFIYDRDIPFHPVRAAGRADAAPLLIDGAPPRPLAVWPLERPEGADKPLAKGVATELCAVACAAEVVRLLNLSADGRALLDEPPRPLRAGDLAVLVRNRNEAAAVREALRAAGVGSVFIARDSVFASDEARQVLQVLAAVVEPSSERALRAALASDLLGLDAAALDALGRDEEAWESWLDTFHAYHALWRDHGLMAMFQRLLHERDSARRLLRLPDGERRLTNLLQVGELLQVAAERQPGMEPMLRWLAQQCEAPEGDNEVQQLRLESDENLVQVVTIHRSKGLEYPVVLLPFIWSARAAAGGDGPLLYHEGVELCADLGSEEREAHRLAAERERLAEDLRLLYVALTRARYRCCFAWGAVNGAADSALAWLLHQDPDAAQPAADMARLDDAAIRRDLEALGGHLEFLPLPARAEPLRGAADSGDRPAARRFRGRIDSDWRVTSYSGLLAGHDAERPDYDALAGEPEEPAAARPALDRHSFPRGARAGLFLHGLLEQLDFQARDEALLEAEVGRQLERHGFGEHWRGAVAAWVRDVLATPLDAAGKLRLSDLRRADRRDEMAFYYPLARLTPKGLSGVLRRVAGYRAGGPPLTFAPVAGMMKGYIDLVFRHAGRFYLADYKSNHLGEGRHAYVPAALRAAMAEHRYDLQYLIYCVALHRYLKRRLPDYDYARHFGGVYYLFLRGMEPLSGPERGVFFERPEPALIAALDGLFAGGEG